MLHTHHPTYRSIDRMDAMVGAPVCPTCGWQLTWFPEHRTWGCDRCRVMMPAAGATAPGGPAKSRKNLWIGVGALGAVAVGITIAVAMGKGGGGGGGLATSVHDALSRAFSAPNEGDTEALVSGAGLAYIKTQGDCTKTADQADR